MQAVNTLRTNAGAADQSRKSLRVAEGGWGRDRLRVPKYLPGAWRTYSGAEFPILQKVWGGICVWCSLPLCGCEFSRVLRREGRADG
jgi:hypothetical protein